MIVRCLANSLASLKTEQVKLRLSKSVKVDQITDLSVGVEYEVVAIESRQAGIWVFLPIVHDEHPYPYPLELFEVVDSRIPQDWSLRFGDEDPISIKLLAFEEWARDPNFYEKLIDGDPEALHTYRIRTRPR